MGIFQSATLSPLLIIQQSFLITSLLLKWKWNGFNRNFFFLTVSLICTVFFHHLQIKYGNDEENWRGQINRELLRFSQSRPAWCCFKILSSHWILLLVADLQDVKNTHSVSNLARRNSKHLSVCLEVPSVLVISLSFGPVETHFAAPIPED